MNCDTARIYCGAVADGELGEVPRGVLAHIQACHDCSTEVQWQREAQDAVAGALVEPPASGILPLPVFAPARRGWRRGAALGVVAAAAAMILIAGTVILGRGGPSPALRPAAELAITDAAHAYGNPAAFSSSDPAAIAGWSAGRGMAVDVMTVPGAAVTGARVSNIQGHPMVTVIYTGAAGTIEVTVVPPVMTGGWPAMEAMKVNRTPVGLVHRGADGVIVVTPSDRELHAAMSALQAA